MKFRNMTISFAVLTLVGCKNIFEDNDLTLDGSLPYAEVEAPRKNNAYKTIDPLRLNVGYSDKDKVEELDVTINREGDQLRGSANVVAFKKTPKAKLFDLDTTFAANTFAAGNYKVLIKATDSRKNVGTQEIAFTVK